MEGKRKELLGDVRQKQSIQTVSGTHLVSYLMGSGASTQVKRSDCKFDRTTPSSGHVDRSYNSRLQCAFMFNTGTTLLLCKGYKHRFVTRKPPTSGNVSDYKLTVASRSASGLTQNRG
jgi:hypothetical protein